jgi:hypothetical protein
MAGHGVVHPRRLWQRRVPHGRFRLWTEFPWFLCLQMGVALTGGGQSKADNLDFRGLGRPGRPENLPKIWGAKPPHILRWFPGRPGGSGNRSFWGSRRPRRELLPGEAFLSFLKAFLGPQHKAPGSRANPPSLASFSHAARVGRRSHVALVFRIVWLPFLASFSHAACCTH